MLGLGLGLELGLGLGPGPGLGLGLGLGFEGPLVPALCGKMGSRGGKGPMLRCRWASSAWVGVRGIGYA